ncbi:DUF2225 domain-containing protein [Desulfofundulus thermobenzoicus]|uniref:DUF2225 domain-containing protein n=1 Tax=Desulfofundulus thermobenzoicus TaxID=29376 RepID=A0A6N7ISJ6_9FIRM|nr:DUF2225 domain-containing protein [Desulfofundulus thermobenzoicus]MQL52911.1 DUF2225 domain-containing protein [Desulfofundulus thermobenzoicus]
MDVDMNKLAWSGLLKHFKQGETIFLENQAGEEMYIILRGRVEISRGREPSKTTLAVLNSGSFFGEMSLLEGLPRSASAVALDDVILIAINHENFARVIQSEPQLAIRIMRGLSHRIRTLNEQLHTVPDDTRPPAQQPGHSPAGRTTAPAVVNPFSIAEISTTKKVGNGKTVATTVNGRVNNNKVNGINTTGGHTAQAGNTHPYLYDKSLTCPVCSVTFQAREVKGYKLKVVGQDYDFRQHFADFEPLWYSVWVCPRCYYANSRADFSTITERQKHILQEQQAERIREAPRPLEEPGTPGYALQSHLLAIKSLEQMQAEPEKIARMWLHLGWLYTDAREEEKARHARQQALEKFKEYYFASRRPLTTEQDQQLAYLIGELHYQLSSLEEALQFFRRAVVHRGGNPVINERARDRIYELKAAMKK